jgi:hypothetical protein
MEEIGPAAAGAFLPIAFTGNTGLQETERATGVARLPQDFLAILVRVLRLPGEGGQAFGACLYGVPLAAPEGGALATLFGLSGQGLELGQPASGGASGERMARATPGSGAPAPDAEPDTSAGSAVDRAQAVLSDVAFQALLQVAVLCLPLRWDVPEPLDSQLLATNAATEALAVRPRYAPWHTVLLAGLTAARVPVQSGQAGTPAADAAVQFAVSAAQTERGGGQAYGHAEGALRLGLEEHPAARSDAQRPGQDRPLQLPRPDQAPQGPADDIPAPAQHALRPEISDAGPEVRPPPPTWQVAAPSAAHDWEVSPWVPGAPAQPARPADRAAVERPAEQHPTRPLDVSAQPGVQPGAASAPPAGAPAQPAHAMSQPPVAGLADVRPSRPVGHSGESGAGSYEVAASPAEPAPGPILVDVARPATGQTTHEHSPSHGGEAEDRADRRTGQAASTHSRTQRDESDLQAGLPALAPAQSHGEPGSRAVPPQSLVMQVLSQAHLLTGPAGRVVRFRLEPEQLGELEVRLVLRAHGGLDLHIAASADDVGRALVAAWPELRDALAARGLHAEELLVTVRGSDLALSTSGGGPHSSPGHGRPFERPLAALYGPANSGTVATEASPAGGASPDRQPAGRLDYRV